MKQIDIVNFLAKNKGGLIIKSFPWWGPLRSRVLAFTAWRNNYFSFSEFCHLLLPLSSHKKKKLMERYAIFLQKEILKECPAGPDNSVSLFGYKFQGPDYHETLKLIYDVIVKDQYLSSQYLKKDSVIVDAGANIGVFTALAANIATDGKIFAFEPVSKTFSCLRKNTQNYHNVVVENSGLGDAMVNKNIFVNSQSTGISVMEDSALYKVKAERDLDGKMEQVQLSTLDAYVQENSISHIDFIKIDTEGYESQILKGAKQTIAAYHPIIAMSAYHNPEDKEELPRLLESIAPGYICQLHKGAEDDFICYIP